MRKMLVVAAFMCASLRAQVPTGSVTRHEQPPQMQISLSILLSSGIEPFWSLCGLSVPSRPPFIRRGASQFSTPRSLTRSTILSDDSLPISGVSQTSRRRPHRWLQRTRRRTTYCWLFIPRFRQASTESFSRIWLRSLTGNRRVMASWVRQTVAAEILAFRANDGAREVRRDRVGLMHAGQSLQSWSRPELTIVIGRCTRHRKFQYPISEHPTTVRTLFASIASIV